MPIHDWSRVSAGTFHDFHNTWISEVKVRLNEGLLPDGYYAQSEQYAGAYRADILTLKVDEIDHDPMRSGGAVAVAENPPRVSRKVVAREIDGFRLRRRTIAVRRTNDHEIVALIEIASPANKDRQQSVRQFVKKVEDSIEQGWHVLVVDLLPPGRSDPAGLNVAICENIGDVEPDPTGKALSLASYVAMPMPEAHLEWLGVGDVLPDMPLFLSPETYVNIPLETTYMTAFRGTAAIWRAVLEKP